MAKQKEIVKEKVVAQAEVQATEVAATVGAAEDTVPTYTIRADSAFGIRCMVMVRDLAVHHLPAEERRVIAAKLREFDLYEERTRS